MSAEAHLEFACFGGTASVHVRAEGAGKGRRMAEAARDRLLDAHVRLSRFELESELSRLNRDPREVVPASHLMCRLAAAVGTAGRCSGGLVDATLVGEIERAGYDRSLDDGPAVGLEEALAAHPHRAPGGPRPDPGWSRVAVQAGAVERPPGLGIDSGGIAKGLLADLLAAQLRESRAFAVDCCGDVRIGGRGSLARRVLVDDPFGGPPVHELSLRSGAVATSGIGRRCWIGPDGRPAHHLLDPSTGTPAFTGIVQVTAVAPTALLAEVHAKAALLSGPDAVAERLPYGGVVVGDDRTVTVLAARPRAQVAQVAA